MVNSMVQAMFASAIVRSGPPMPGMVSTIFCTGSVHARPRRIAW